MTGPPVFDDPEDLRLWRRIAGGGRGVLGRKESPEALTEAVVSKEGEVHPALLCALLDMKGGRASDEDLERIVGKSRARDSSPSVKAAGMALNRGDPELAYRLLSMSDGSAEVAGRSLMRARIAMSQDDIAGAKAYAAAAYGADPSCQGPYDILSRVDPSGGWRQKRAIAMMADGLKPGIVSGTGKHQELYSIYHDRACGDAGAARQRLRENRYRKGDDPEFVLADARFSAWDGDRRSAAGLYSAIVGLSPAFVAREAAENLLAMGDAEGALEMLGRIEGAVPGASRDAIECRLRTGSRRGLMDAVRRYLEDEGSGLDEHLDMVTMLRSGGRPDDSDAILSRMCRVYGDDPDVLSAVSETRLEDGDVQGAASAAAKAVRRDRGSIRARLQMARVHMAAGNLSGAVKDCNTVLSADGTNRDALVLLKDVSDLRGDPHGALEICMGILERYPDDVRTMKSAARALNQLGYGEGVRDMLRRASEADSGKDNLLDIAGMLVDMRMFRDAVRLCCELQRDCPPDARVLFLKGNAQYGSGEYTQAATAYADAVRMSPDDPVLWHSKGLADEMCGNTGSARDDYSRAIGLDPSNPDYWISMASAEEDEGRIADSVRSLDRAMQLDPRNVYPVVRKAMLLKYMGRYDEAVFFTDLALKMSPGRTELLSARLSMLTSAGRHAEAVKAGESLLPSKNRELLCRIAESMLSAGEPEKALDVVGAIDGYCVESEELRRRALEAMDVPVEEEAGEEDMDTVRKLAERALRRAASSKTSLNDPELFASLGMDPRMALHVAHYLSDIPDRGGIDPSDDGFRRMERQSHETVMRIRWRDLEGHPLLPIEKVYAAGFLMSVEDAKEVVAYIYAAMTCDAPGRSDRLSSACAKVRGDPSVYRIMEVCNLGVYEARTVKGMLSSRASRTS